MLRQPLLFALIPFFCVSLASVARAGKYNPVLDPGSPAPAWTNLPGVDSKKHSLSDLKAKEAVVVFFTCNSCPYAVEYEDRVIAFVKKFASGDNSKVAVVAINVNKINEDNLEAMKARASKRKFPFIYLYDESQEIAKKFGAIRTPEFFVLDKDRKIAYMGAFDDDTDPQKAKVGHVEDAVARVLKGGKPEIQETVAIGCAIRFERTRRSRRSKSRSTNRSQDD